MRVLGVTQTMPLWDNTGREFADHLKRSMKAQFYDELDFLLAETPGGLIIAPPVWSERQDHDWFAGGEFLTLNLTATVEELPEPPEFRLIGGPADGHIVRTRGERTWLVPVMGPPPTATSYAEPTLTSKPLIAEYERQGDTSAYYFKRMTGGSW